MTRATYTLNTPDDVYGFKSHVHTTPDGEWIVMKNGKRLQMHVPLCSGCDLPVRPCDCEIEEMARTNAHKARLLMDGMIGGWAR